MNERLMTTRELAERWGVHPGSIANSRSQGADHPAYVRLGALVRYRLSAVEAWEATRTVEASV